MDSSWKTTHLVCKPWDLQQITFSTTTIRQLKVRINLILITTPFINRQTYETEWNLLPTQSTFQITIHVKDGLLLVRHQTWAFMVRLSNIATLDCKTGILFTLENFFGVFFFRSHCFPELRCTFYLGTKPKGCVGESTYLVCPDAPRKMEITDMVMD